MIYPKIIKNNYRYRGPVESLKINNQNKDISNALMELKETIKIHQSSLDKFSEESFGDKRYEKLMAIDNYELRLEIIKEE